MKAESSKFLSTKGVLVYVFVAGLIFVLGALVPSSEYVK